MQVSAARADLGMDKLRSWGPYRQLYTYSLPRKAVSVNLVCIMSLA